MGKISGNKRYRVLSRTNGRCWYCGFEFPDEALELAERACIDHIVSLSNGGNDDEHNLRPACWQCNSAKQTKSVEEFRYCVWHRDSNNIKAAQKLLDAINLSSTPFNEEMQQAIDWLIAQSPVIIFWGEENEIF